MSESKPKPQPPMLLDARRQRPPDFVLNVVEGKLVVQATVDSRMLPVLIRALQGCTEWLSDVEARIASNRSIATEPGDTTEKTY